MSKYTPADRAAWFNIWRNGITFDRVSAKLDKDANALERLIFLNHEFRKEVFLECLAENPHDDVALVKTFETRTNANNVSRGRQPMWLVEAELNCKAECGDNLVLLKRCFDKRTECLF